MTFAWDQWTDRQDLAGWPVRSHAAGRIVSSRHDHPAEVALYGIGGSETIGGQRTGDNDARHPGEQTLFKREQGCSFRFVEPALQRCWMVNKANGIAGRQRITEPGKRW